ncbi:MAG: hypothetical protein COU46_03140 [Candidatus Niyogibacteria bacterium CG10_big_fil_rev_8_21_14_0_10_42_19]|uniref:Uncharacterized protein n=1 Tax=Candidatus Niyogibacteria bacterium CG10_big_fil_rev_8_21_14_0_10_42_19 TaxID=1974725 RepID=A0A2H0TEZ8_9BACT|nr:MAG: hypothetical protein COU46_03140 [Candidatus Niyogibacteria bacterium CG10_big_fil_rev_8_21_14_0_10_42_19]
MLQKIKSISSEKYLFLNLIINIVFYCGFFLAALYEKTPLFLVIIWLAAFFLFIVLLFFIGLILLFCLGQNKKWQICVGLFIDVLFFIFIFMAQLT